MTRIRLIAATFGIAALQACMSVPETSIATAVPPNLLETSIAIAVPPSTPISQNFLFSWGMFADPVFDCDVVTFDRAFSQAYGVPEETELFGYTAARLSNPDVAAMQSQITQMAADAVDGRDTVIVMLTSHGSPNRMALKTEPDGRVGSISADGLAAFLSPLADDRQILILQACFSGSLIDELQSPNRIIMTASAADRSSFGCNPESDNLVHQIAEPRHA